MIYNIYFKFRTSRTIRKNHFLYSFIYSLLLEDPWWMRPPESPADSKWLSCPLSLPGLGVPWQLRSVQVFSPGGEHSDQRLLLVRRLPAAALPGSLSVDEGPAAVPQPLPAGEAQVSVNHVTQRTPRPWAMKWSVMRGPANVTLLLWTGQTSVRPALIRLSKCFTTLWRTWICIFNFTFDDDDGDDDVIACDDRRYVVFPLPPLGVPDRRSLLNHQHVFNYWKATEPKTCDWLNY